MTNFTVYNNIEIITASHAHTFPLHIHSKSCYGIITSGAAQFFCGQTKVLQTGDTFFVQKGFVHSLAPVDGKPYAYCTLCVDDNASAIQDAFLKEAVSYILSHIPFKIEHMAQEINYSKYHIIHKFKEGIGLPPHQFYLNAQIKKIRYGLMNHQSLPDLAYQLGFSSQSHMCNVFKKYMGISPTQYQRAIQSAGENTAKI